MNNVSTSKTQRNAENVCVIMMRQHGFWGISSFNKNIRKAKEAQKRAHKNAVLLQNQLRRTPGLSFVRFLKTEIISGHFFMLKIYILFKLVEAK